MSDFVAECRREWKRLRVPDSVAAEMAADLAADLSEASSEGVSAEEVLGVGALDARSFAASWAAERGVMDPRPVKRRPRERSLVLGAIAVLSVAALAAGVAILATPTAATSALPAPPDGLSPDGAMRIVYAGSKVTLIDVGSGRVHSATFAPSPLVRAAPQALRVQRSTDTRAIAWALLAAGIVGIVLISLYWWRISRRPPSRHPDLAVS